jgi:hypothetical protein
MISAIGPPYSRLRIDAGTRVVASPGPAAACHALLPANDGQAAPIAEQTNVKCDAARRADQRGVRRGAFAGAFQAARDHTELLAAFPLAKLDWEGPIGELAAFPYRANSSK